MLHRTRPQHEELAAEHLIREHHCGRAMREILTDPSVANRCSEEQIAGLLDRREIVRAAAEATAAAHRPAI
jgi:hypothetical protein